MTVVIAELLFLIVPDQSINKSIDLSKRLLLNPPRRYQGYAMVGSPNEDADGDGISDDEEGFDDKDGDGVPNLIDLDSDGDGLLDQLERNVDSDLDGTKDFLDLDSDNDGILDKYEGRMLAGLKVPPASLTSGLTPAPNSRNPCANPCESWTRPKYPGAAVCVKGPMNATDRQSTWFAAGDTDKDGVPDFLDADSDNDGLPDSVEWSEPRGRDVDGDGIDNYVDDDSDNDGICDAVEGLTDPDFDNLPSFIDLDSDGDGILDAVEEYWEQALMKRPALKYFLDLDCDKDTIPDRF